MTNEERKARRLVSERSGSCCESCSMQRATEFQHRKRISQGGNWSTSNGLHLCHTCHSWVTHHPVAAGLLGLHCFRWEDPKTKPVKLFGRGWCLLDDTGQAIPCAPPERGVA